MNYKGTESFLQSVPTQFKPRLETRWDAASARWCFQPSSEILGRQQSAEEPRRRLPPVPALRSGGRRVNGACGLCFSPKIHAWPYAPKRHRFFFPLLPSVSRCAGLLLLLGVKTQVQVLSVKVILAFSLGVLCVLSIHSCYLLSTADLFLSLDPIGLLDNWLQIDLF